MNNFEKPTYIIPSTTYYYDAKVENKIAYVYGLKLENEFAYFTKLAAGRFNDLYYNDNPDCLNKNLAYNSFFNFKNHFGLPCAVFEAYYPEASAYIQKLPLYTINLSGTTLYWDNQNFEWTTTKDKRTYYFTNDAAKLDQEAISANFMKRSLQPPITTIDGSKLYKIKYLVVNCFIDFPCSSFQSKNMKDYQEE